MCSGLCPRQQPPPPGLFSLLQRALITSVPAVLALVLLPPLAFASPPDPWWVAGIYDGADGDDVVSLVYETSAAHAAVLSHLGPLPCLLGLSLEGIVHAVRVRHFTRGSRSPPVVSSMEFAYVFSSLPPPPPGTEEFVDLSRRSPKPLVSQAGVLPPVAPRKPFSSYGSALSVPRAGTEDPPVSSLP